MALLVKAWICNLRIAGSSLTAGEVLFWYGPLASLSFQIASVDSDHHAKRWRSQPAIGVKIVAQLLKIHLSLLDKSSRISVGDV